VDLGLTPLANSFLPFDDPLAISSERRFPLHVVVCNDCWLVQTTETPPADAIFSYDYAYLSSSSESWVTHAARYAQEAIARFGLDKNSMVVEVASNDGYLLQHFVKVGIPVLGIEPAGHAASLALEKGVPTKMVFFNEDTAIKLKSQGFSADLMTANNVLAHVPEIKNFVKGFQVLLKRTGVATFEFPHLVSLMESVQFDTIYHEHYSYLSLTFVDRLMKEVELEIFDVEKLSTHGGSLRVFVCQKGTRSISHRVADAQADEDSLNMRHADGYKGIEAKVELIVTEFRAFLAQATAEGKTVAGYGAAAKGNTFLNVAGINASDVAFIVDVNPMKQNTLLPGSHIPVCPVDNVSAKRPDYLVIFPWNIAAEVIEQQEHIREWGGQFVTALPALTIQ
jgi:2-polyprenyl-3-methyl-5-hydroxy-6-metoxy-1,4-benzoquinol methylase